MEFDEDKISRLRQMIEPRSKWDYLLIRDLDDQHSQVFVGLAARDSFYLDDISAGVKQ